MDSKIIGTVVGGTFPAIFGYSLIADALRGTGLPDWISNLGAAAGVVVVVALLCKTFLAYHKSTEARFKGLAESIERNTAATSEASGAIKMLVGVLTPQQSQRRSGE